MTGAVEAFVGSYAAAGDTGIHVFAVDGAVGEVRPIGGTAGIANPSFLVLHPEGSRLYAVSETSAAGDGVAGGVHAFAVERTNGRVDLVALGSRSSEGDHPCHLALDPSGRWLAVANYSSGSVAVFPLEPDGGLGERTAFVQHEGRGPNPARQESAHAHSSLFSRDGRFLLVADLGIDRIAVYRFADGSLELHAMVPTAPGSGPRHMAFTSDGERVLVVGELDNTLSAYVWEEGELQLDAVVPTLPPDAPETTSADLHVVGSRAFVSNRGHDSVAVVTVDPVAGLRLAVTRSCGGAWPRGFGVVPDGRHLLVANRHSDELVLLPVDGTEIGPAIARAPVAEPSCVVFGPSSEV